MAEKENSPRNEKSKQNKKGGKNADKDAPVQNELSAEDLALKENLELAVVRSSDVDANIQRTALELIRTEIQNATTTMTSVPKPLKFLIPHYNTLVNLFRSGVVDESNNRLLADILSVLSMTKPKAPEGEEAAKLQEDSPEPERNILNYKLAGNRLDLGSWGHEYIRSLCGELGEEYNHRIIEDPNANVEDLNRIIDEIVPFHIQHNAIADAVDLLAEVHQLSKLLNLSNVDRTNFDRICLYLLKFAGFATDPDDYNVIMQTAFQLYIRQQDWANGLRVALKLNNSSMIAELFDRCPDPMRIKQLAYLLARARVNHEFSDEELTSIINNTNLNSNFLHLARDLDVMAPKVPEDIYKSHLAETGSLRRTNGTEQIDSAKYNLASSFVNAFVNAGYGKDKLLTEEGSSWVHKNLDRGKISAVASLGMIYLWNIDVGLTEIDKYLYSDDPNVKAGACLAIGITSSGVRDESDAAFALLSDQLEHATGPSRSTIYLALGLAYAGTHRADVSQLLLPYVANSENPDMVEAGNAALALGMIFVGSCDEDISTTLLQRLMESSQTELDQPFTKFMILSLGLLFLNQMEKADAICEAVRTIEHPIGQQASIILSVCAYAATGNVLQIQKLLYVCAEHIVDPKTETPGEGAAEEKATTATEAGGANGTAAGTTGSSSSTNTGDGYHQALAVIGIALVALGDDLSTDMCMRMFDHLIHYCELNIKRAIPLAIALLYASNPDYPIVDQLSRLSHDMDNTVSQAAILGLGIIGTGTNNSRIAGILRQLSDFYNRQDQHLMMVRLSQALLHTGKGLLSIHPFQSDRFLLSNVSLAGILTVLIAGLDLSHTLLGDHHYLLYSLVISLNPRMLLTLDEDLKPLPVSVRVGQAVEIVGQAGRPKTISGFQTHMTPVLLGVKDRAELADPDYEPLTSVLEDIVILRRKQPVTDMETK